MKYPSIVFGIAIVNLLLACASTREAEKKVDTIKDKTGDKEWNFTATAAVPTANPDGTVTAKPFTLNVVGKEQAKEVSKEVAKEDVKEVQKTNIDADAVASTIATKIAPLLASAVPGGSSLSALIGTIAGGGGIAAAGFTALKNLTLGAALKDAVAFGSDAIAATTPDQIKEVQDKHRAIQLHNKTRDVIRNHI